jgi:transcription initiation factor IIE alpha subunit
MFEKEAIEITCPKCDHKSEENVGRLKTDGYTCPNCGYNCDPNELARAIKEVEDSVEKLKRQIARSKKTAENG